MLKYLELFRNVRETYGFVSNCLGVLNLFTQTESCDIDVPVIFHIMDKKFLAYC